jgi:multidrug resistance efflux pump
MLAAGFREEEVAQAQARYEQLSAELEKLENGPREQEISAARANLDLANSELVLAKEVFDRTRSLLARDAANQDQLDRATKELQAAGARVQAEQEQLDLLLEGTRAEEIAAARARQREAKAGWDLAEAGDREEEIAQAYAGMNAAQGALGAIDRQIAELEIKAPVTGDVQAVELQPGDLVGPNAPVISLIDTSRLWVRAFVPEDELDISIGQHVPITVDSFPDEIFTGEISFIAREAEFTPRNVQTPEERSQQVFRIKVTLTDGLDRLRAGMAADVWLEAP